MKIYKFNDLHFYKPNLIKIVGPGSVVKEHLAKRLIISMHDKYKNIYYPNEYSNKNFGLTIFTYEAQLFYPKNIKNMTINYYTTQDKIRDFYLTRKFNMEENKELPIEIVLFDMKLLSHNPKSKTFKYTDKLLLNYKKLNLIIIYHDYYASDIDSKYSIDYTLCLQDCLDGNTRHIYKKYFDKSFIDYETFKKTYREITKCNMNKMDGVMVLKKNVKNKFYKLDKLYCSESVRLREKHADPNYDPISDDSNIRLM